MKKEKRCHHADLHSPYRGTESSLRFLRQSAEVPVRCGGYPLLHRQQQDPHLEPRISGRPVAPCGRVRQRPLRQERGPAGGKLPDREGSGPGSHRLPQRIICPWLYEINTDSILSTGRPRLRPAGFSFQRKERTCVQQKHAPFSYRTDAGGIPTAHRTGKAVRSHQAGIYCSPLGREPCSVTPLALIHI